jgi:hypothetical protein
MMAHVDDAAVAEVLAGLGQDGARDGCCRLLHRLHHPDAEHEGRGPPSQARRGGLRARVGASPTIASTTAGGPQCGLITPRSVSLSQTHLTARA